MPSNVDHILEAITHVGPVVRPRLAQTTPITDLLYANWKTGYGNSAAKECRSRC